MSRLAVSLTALALYRSVSSRSLPLPMVAASIPAMMLARLRRVFGSRVETARSRSTGWSVSPVASVVPDSISAAAGSPRVRSTERLTAPTFDPAWMFAIVPSCGTEGGGDLHGHDRVARFCEGDIADPADLDRAGGHGPAWDQSPDVVELGLQGVGLAAARDDHKCGKREQDDRCDNGDPGRVGAQARLVGSGVGHAIGRFGLKPQKMKREDHVEHGHEDQVHGHRAGRRGPHLDRSAAHAVAEVEGADDHGEREHEALDHRVEDVDRVEQPCRRRTPRCPARRRCRGRRRRATTRPGRRTGPADRRSASMIIAASILVETR